jgi:hypothetical protein
MKAVAWQDSEGYHFALTNADRTRDTRSEYFGLHPCQSSDDLSQGLKEWFASIPGFTNIRDRSLAVNQYYPRIYRPGAIALKPQQGMTQSALAVSVLTDRLEHLFRVIEPNEDNLKVFGHEIRSLLLLACMEVEAALRTILDANGNREERLGTGEYVKLRDPLRLPDYTLQLAFYPNAGRFAPFSTWEPSKPTQSLPWYDAYNKTKHDRENHFHEATLEHAIEAVCAAVILFYAQFGIREPHRFGLFAQSKTPRFSLEERYLWKKASKSQRKPFPGTWTPVEYPL